LLSQFEKEKKSFNFVQIRRRLLKNIAKVNLIILFKETEKIMSANYLPKAIGFFLFIGGFNLELLDKDGKNLLNLTEGVQGLNDKNVKSFNKKRVVVIEYLKCICKCKMQIEVHFLGSIFLFYV